jgi:hypothetical protein
MAKVFEGEVSQALHRLKPGYVHKCPDHPHAIPDKVDFLGVYKAVGFGIEAKEVKQHDEVGVFPLITPNQRSCLQSIYEADGFAAVVINFDRVRGVNGRVGFCFGWKYIDVDWDDPNSRFSIYDEAAALIPRVSGGWAIDEWIRRAM